MKTRSLRDGVKFKNLAKKPYKVKCSDAQTTLNAVFPEEATDEAIIAALKGKGCTGTYAEDLPNGKRGTQSVQFDHATAKGFIRAVGGQFLPEDAEAIFGPEEERDPVG